MLRRPTHARLSSPNPDFQEVKEIKVEIKKNKSCGKTENCEKDVKKCQKVFDGLGSVVYSSVLRCYGGGEKRITD